jgi:hypothetical protein
VAVKRRIALLACVCTIRLARAQHSSLISFSLHLFLNAINLQSHTRLNYLTHCEFAYHLKKDDVCVNPYHYIKAEPEFVQPQSPSSHHQHQLQQLPHQLSILVPKYPNGSSESSTVSSFIDDLSNTVPLNIQYNALK